MKTLQDYKDIYRNIANNLGLKGDSVELLVQMLANSSYITEVENITYMKEASLDKATLTNSKIQKCMDLMYSVYRGQCPRILLKIKPSKYFSFKLFDEIISSNNFSLYYIGYVDKDSTGKNSEGSESVSIEEGFVYSPLSISAAESDDDVYTIICLMASETVEKTWTLNSANTYYVECDEDGLSNDVSVKINNEPADVTRNFSDHIVDKVLFDLTTTGFGSRLYIGDVIDFTNTEELANTSITATYYKYIELDTFNTPEIKKLKLSGAELVSFDESWLSSRSYTELTTGIITISEHKKDEVISIHYKANRNRYVNSIIRSNSEIGTILEEMYPGKIMTDGTNYEFTNLGDSSVLNIYYVPKNTTNLLSTSEIEEFKEKRKAYYVTDTINVSAGDQYTAVFNISVELYNSGTVDDTIKEILSSYEKKFNMDINSKLDEIRSLISKISNIKLIKNLSITYLRNGETEEKYDDIDLGHSYFTINTVISTTIQS